MQDDNKMVSVIVPVYNAEKTISMCIESLLNMEYSNKEIIVVDNGSTDKTVEIARKYNVKILSERRRNSYIARNTGVREAHGEIIAFTDADCVVDKFWCKNLVKHYYREDVGGVGGPILPYAWPYISYYPTNIIEKFAVMSHKTAFPDHSSMSKKYHELRRKNNVLHSGTIYTANASFRKDILVRLGGFDEKFFSGGDIDLSYRILKSGYKLIWDNDAVVYHIPRASFKGLLKQFYRYGTACAPLVKKHFTKKYYIVAAHYKRIFKNFLIFFFRLASYPFSKERDILFVLYPMLDNLILLSLILGKITGSIKHGVVVL